jgi:hypothetical protein
MIPTTFEYIAERAASYPVIMRRSQMCKSGFILLGDNPDARRKHGYFG